MSIYNNDMDENIELKNCTELNHEHRLKNLKDIQENSYKENSLFSLNSTLYLLLYFFLYFVCSIFLYEWLEGWSPITCIYFSIITFSTVGYGDYHPTDSLAQIFTAFYIIFGVIIGGGFIAVLSNYVKQSEDYAKNKRDVEIISQMNLVNGLYVNNNDELNNTIINPLSDVKENENENENNKDNNLNNLIKVHDNDFKTTELKSLYLQTHEKVYLELLVNFYRSILLVVVLILGGSLLMCYIEEWYYIKAFYWCVVTISTIGYGDVTPTTDEGKLFTCFFVIFACPLLAKSVYELVCFPLAKISHHNEKLMLDQFSTSNLSSNTLSSILNGDLFEKYPKLKLNKNKICKSEFVLLILHMMDKINEKDIIIVQQLFDTLNKSNKEYLTVDELSNEHEKATTRESLIPVVEKLESNRKFSLNSDLHLNRNSLANRSSFV